MTTSALADQRIFRMMQAKYTAAMDDDQLSEDVEDYENGRQLKARSRSVSRAPRTIRSRSTVRQGRKRERSMVADRGGESDVAQVVARDEPALKRLHSSRSRSMSRGMLSFCVECTSRGESALGLFSFHYSVMFV
jgi:hypothetical protein